MNTIMIFVTATLAGLAAYGQTAETKLPATDAEKIADALRAGPDFVTKDATLLDWPSKPGGAYRVLRQGTGAWTCLPAVPGYPHDEPGCFDAVFLRWMQDSLAGRTPHINRMGISYMYLGAWKAGKVASSSQEFHVGPHLMVVGPDQDEFRELNRDATNGMPYVTHLPNRA